MKRSSYVVIGIAGVAAVLLAVLVRSLIVGQPSTNAAAVNSPVVVQQPTVRVLVAARDVKAGTRLSPEDLSWQDWPQNLVNPLYIVEPGSESDTPAAGSENSAVEKTGQAVSKAVDTVMNGTALDHFVGGVAREDLLANEPIIESRIVRADEGG